MFSKIVLVVIRWNGTGFRMSKPCKHCTQYLKYIGIKKVYYSTDEGTLKYEKVNNMSSDHVCMVRRLIPLA